MSVVNPRNRLVNFRLSEDEFTLMQETCFNTGARSISEFARMALLAFLERGPESFETDAQPENGDLDQRVRDLEDRVAELVKLMEGAGVPGEDANGGWALARAGLQPRSAGLKSGAD